MPKISTIDDFMIDVNDQMQKKELRYGRQVTAFCDINGKIQMVLRTRKIDVSVRKLYFVGEGVGTVKLKEVFYNMKNTFLLEILVLPSEKTFTEKEIEFLEGIMIWLKAVHSSATIMRFLPVDFPSHIDAYILHGFKLKPKTGREPFNLANQRMGILELQI